MNIRSLLIPTLAILALSGCGQKGPSTSAQPDSGAGSAASATSSTTASSGGGSAASTAARTIEITANDQMKYSVTSIEAKPGEQLHIVLTNAGSLPKEAMAHNWVLLKAGSDVMAFAAAAGGARDQGYIPANLQDQIIAKIDLLGPHQTGEVTFKAPEQPGQYPFLCSFPGHVALMKGTLTVK